jgi:hypothetical protein
MFSQFDIKIHNYQKSILPFSNMERGYHLGNPFNMDRYMATGWKHTRSKDSQNAAVEISEYHRISLKWESCILLPPATPPSVPNAHYSPMLQPAPCILSATVTGLKTYSETLFDCKSSSNYNNTRSNRIDGVQHILRDEIILGLNFSKRRCIGPRRIAVYRIIQRYDLHSTACWVMIFTGFKSHLGSNKDVRDSIVQRKNWVRHVWSKYCHRESMQEQLFLNTCCHLTSAAPFIRTLFKADPVKRRQVHITKLNSYQASPVSIKKSWSWQDDTDYLRLSTMNQSNQSSSSIPYKAEHISS